jgi:predicted O-linked N-acetylglucosamine transferase (SPINDLY family)
MKRAVTAHRGGDLDKAERLYRAVLKATPDNADAFQLLGVIECQRGRTESGIRLMDNALSIQPRHANALHNRANALFDINRLQEAIENYRQALAVQKNPHVHSNLIFALNFDPESSTAAQQAERKRWYTFYARKFAPPDPQYRNDPDPNRRLRIGYVSSHFRRQAATFAFGGVIASHDASRFEVVCYSDTAKEDDLTARLRGRAHKWHSTSGLSDEKLAELIRADSIDILVDCVGHMNGHRLFVFARKPAPVQVTAWGEPTGTGLDTMDYLLADPVLVPANERALFAEQIFDLPNFLGYWRVDSLPEATPLPAMRNGYVTFGSVNRHVKVQEPVLRAWAAILRALPNARLLLKWNERSIDFSGRITDLLAEDGVGRERITHLGRTGRMKHFAAYQSVDLVLDPFPHGGGMTTLDALWMGVPVITWRGNTISSRLAAATLTSLDLADFVVPDLASYVELAVAKTKDLDALARTRASLRERVAGSTIGDPSRYARAVEAAYVEMWTGWCSRQRSRA